MEELGSFFVGIGVMAVAFVIAYWFYQLARETEAYTNKECKYHFLEELGIEKVANKVGIDLNKEALKRGMIAKKSFRRKIQDKIYEEMFPKETKKEKPEPKVFKE